MALPPDPVGVAIVTGGSSGIGLALTTHLMAKKWHVFILDIQPPILKLLPDYATYLPTDVADWDQLAASFETAHNTFQRLDFAALNAGIDDRDDIFNSLSKTNPPKKPNMRTFEVNLFGPYYGLKLAAHYMNMSPGGGGGKIILTASAAAFYAHPVVPQYSATKYGVLGLTRAIAPFAADTNTNIRVNCLCPAMVATGLAPPGLLDAYPAAALTPMKTMLRAFDELALFDGLAREGREKWVREGPWGKAVEVDREMVREREEERIEMDESVSAAVGEAWVRVYRERNTKFAEQGAADGS